VDLTMCGYRISNKHPQTEDLKEITCPKCRFIIEKGRSANIEQAHAYAAHLSSLGREIETFCREAQLSLKKTNVYDLLSLVRKKANEQSSESIGIATASDKTSQQRQKGKIRKI
jgi:hypothetical protein